MATYINGIQIGVSGAELEAYMQLLQNQFQDKLITFNDKPNVLVTTALQQLLELAGGKANIVVADELPATTTANTQYWVKTYDGQTKESGRFIILTDSTNVATYIGESEVDLSDYFKIENLKVRLNGDYYYAFVKDSTTYYTKSIADGEVDVYAITKTEGYVSEITKQSTKGTLANGVLTFSEVEYTHNILADGFFVVKENEKAVAVSAVQDVMEKAGKVNDIKVANVSQVKDKVATIKTVDNLEDNFYFAFKNGSVYRYTKSKAVGQTACYQFTYTDDVLTKIENIGNITIYLNEKTIPEFTIGTTKYTLDETKNDYYIIDSEQVLPSAKCATQDLTDNDIKRIFEGFYLTPPNPSWKYVGILSATNGSTLKVEDDWTELLLVVRVSEGSSYYNLTNVIPKYGFTQGSPNGNQTFVGFFWNESYNCKIRVGIAGTGSNRVVKQDYSNVIGWVLNGTYIFKR